MDLVLLREALSTIHLSEARQDKELNNETFEVGFEGQEPLYIKGLNDVFNTLEDRLGYEISDEEYDQIISRLLKSERVTDEDETFYIERSLQNSEEEINDLDIYNQRMAAGMADKLFFLDKVPDVNTIVDFGCADGELLRLIPDT